MIVVVLLCHFSILKKRNNGDPLICAGSGEISLIILLLQEKI